MTGYYEEKLAADRLELCYEIASSRVKRYLQAEIDHVASRIEAGDLVCELGCGYGRVLGLLAEKARKVVGIDTSLASLAAARKRMPSDRKWCLVVMDASALAFRNDSFAVVACIQNGISAFKRDPKGLLAEAVRVCRSRGRVLFSSYADGFWPERLEWFRAQSKAGLLGEIDEDKTRSGVIVCRDGFVSSTVSAEGFRTLVGELGLAGQIFEVDGSSVFCEIEMLA